MGEVVEHDKLAENGAGTIMEVISRAAADPSTDVVKLEKMLDMYERISAKNAEAAFNSALAELQSQLPVISERGEIKVDGKIRSTYARFEDINEAVKPLLKEHGFAVSFRTEFPDDAIHITGILSHKQGHREHTTIKLPADTSGAKNQVQAIGSSVQYGKRYTLSALLNISTGEDDDGNAAAADPITTEQAAELKGLIEETRSDTKAFLKAMGGANSVDELPAAAYNRAKTALNKKKIKMMQGAK